MFMTSEGASETKQDNELIEIINVSIWYRARKINRTNQQMEVNEI